MQGNALTSNFVPPALTIDGYPAPPARIGGSTVISVPAGWHHLEVSSQWLRRYGQAALDVHVPPQTQLQVFYAPPFHQFSTGGMGLTPQPRKGAGLLIGVLVGLIALVSFIVLAATLS